MYCTNCGTQFDDSARFCAQCGKETGKGGSPGFAPRPAVADKKLLRPMDSKWFAGVCAAFADYFSIDVTLVRLLWVMAVIVFGAGFVAYIVCWVVIPRQEFSPVRANLT